MRKVVALLVLVVVVAIAAIASVPLQVWNPSAATNRAAYQRPESKFISIDGTDVHYLDEGTGPVVVLVHGSAESLFAWDGVARDLSKSYRVIRMDIGDQGLSGPDAQNRYTIKDDIARINTLLAKLGVDTFALVGSSWGGTIAYTYAVTFPQRVTGLVLISIPGVQKTMPTFHLSSGDNALEKWIYKYYRPMSAIRHEIASVTVNQDFLTPETVRTFHDLLNQKDRAAHWVTKLSQIIHDETPSYALGVMAQIETPTLVLWGRDNPAFSATSADDLEKLLVHAKSFQKIIYDGVGHKVEREAPEKTAADIGTFLSGLMPATPAP